MTTCKDCICFARCKRTCEIFGIYIDLGNSAVCKHFINKANFAEVVRCKDCAVPHNQRTGCPKLNGLVTPPDFYCSCGESATDTNVGGQKKGGEE